MSRRQGGRALLQLQKQSYLARIPSQVRTQHSTDSPKRSLLPGQPIGLPQQWHFTVSHCAMHIHLT